MKAALPLVVALILATPAAAQDDRVWMFSETEDSVYLGYGIPESDDGLATFVCFKGSNRAELYLTFEHRIATENPTPQGEWVDAQGRPAPWTVELTIAGIDTSAQALADEMNGGSTVSAPMPTDDAILKAIGDAGRLRAEAFGETIAPPPFRKADFRRFLQGCKG